MTFVPYRVLLWMVAFGHTRVPFMGSSRLRMKRAFADRADAPSETAVRLAAIAIPWPITPQETLSPAVIALLPPSLSASVICARAGVALVMFLLHHLLARSRVYHVCALLSHPTRLLTGTMGRVVLATTLGPPVHVNVVAAAATLMIGQTGPILLGWHRVVGSPLGDCLDENKLGPTGP